MVEGRRLGAPIFACGDVTDVVPNHSGTSISTDPFPYCVDLSQFTNSSYIPGENYSSKRNHIYLNNVVTIMHSYPARRQYQC